MAVSTSNVEVSASEVVLEAGLTSSTRTYLHFRNVGSVPVWIGPTGVTPQTGYPLFPGGSSFVADNISQLHNEDIYAVTPYGTSNVRIMEAS